MKNNLELYELILLLKSTSSSTQVSDRINFYRDFLSTRGSQVLVKNHGTRSLAYPIQGLETATNIQFVLLGNGDLLKQINTELQRDELVLRIMVNKLANTDVPEMLEMFNA
jgi:ribosomal protein S6